MVCFHATTPLPVRGSTLLSLCQIHLATQAYQTDGCIPRYPLLVPKMTATTAYARALTPTRLAVIFSLLLAVFFLRDTWLPNGYTTPHVVAETPRPAQGSTKPSEDIKQSASDSCLEVPGANNTLVILKTGATELYQKLPTHFVTLFTCVPHFMIFSDLAQNFADYPVHDAIAPISSHFREHHADFELYRKLEKYQREGQDMSQLKGDGGWNLDKWKFMPMLHQAFNAAPDNIEWFVVMEADTSISWTNLLQWLKTMNPKKAYYLGAQNVIGGTTFAHGGSGIIVSRKAADMLVAKRKEIGTVTYDETWEERTSTSCCGDEVIARAFLEVGVELTPSWPLIQGETVSSIDFTDNHWCTPAITWHHVQPIELDALWQFENEWIDDHGWNTPYLYRDIFEHFIARHVTVNRTSWNNLSQDRKLVASNVASSDDEDFNKLENYEKAAVESESVCASACVKREGCVQWMYSPGRCYLGDKIRFGKSDEREDDHWTSGWLQDRVQKYKDRFEGCKIRWHG